jgi:hypothetical protein
MRKGNVASISFVPFCLVFGSCLGRGDYTKGPQHARATAVWSWQGQDGFMYTELAGCINDYGPRLHEWIEKHFDAFIWLFTVALLTMASHPAYSKC